MANTLQWRNLFHVADPATQDWNASEEGSVSPEFWQEPEAHAQLLLAMFGRFSFEHRNQMLADGSNDTVTAHPWLLQFMDDIDVTFH